MLINVKKVQGSTVAARDGNAGSVEDLYISDQNWQVDYLVVDTGNLFSGKKVVVSPAQIDRFDLDGQVVHLNQTIDEVHQDPEVDTDLPAGYEKEVKEKPEHGPLPPQRLGGGLFQEQHIGMTPDSMVETLRAEEQPEGDFVAEPQEVLARVHKAKDIIGAYIEATDGDIGHIEDLVVDDDTWSIPYAVIDTRNWLPGKKIRLETRSIESVDTVNNKVYISLSQAAVKEQPEVNLSQE